MRALSSAAEPLLNFTKLAIVIAGPGAWLAAIAVALFCSWMQGML